MSAGAGARPGPGVGTIEIEGLAKRYRRDSSASTLLTAFLPRRRERKEHWALRDFDLKLGGGETRRSRQEIADALRQPTFDGVVLGEQFARHDTVIEGARKAFVGLVARVHDTLEPEQRTRLATLVERGPRFGWWQ